MDTKNSEKSALKLRFQSVPVEYTTVWDGTRNCKWGRYITLNEEERHEPDTAGHYNGHHANRTRKPILNVPDRRSEW